MKTNILIFISLFFYCCTTRAQLNTLNVDELANIQFNNFTLSQIRQIEGKDDKAIALFGEGNFTSAINPSCPFLCKYFRIYQNKISFGFEDDSQTEEQFYFTYLNVKDSSIKVTVKDVSVSLGDKIDIFKEKGYLISEKNHWVVFVDEETATIAIRFHFDPSSRQINQIRMTTY